MSTTATTTTTAVPADDDWTPSRFESARWDAGNRLAIFGERLMLAGDRLRGDTPQTVAQAMDESHARGVKAGFEAGVEAMTRILVCGQ